MLDAATERRQKARNVLHSALLLLCLLGVTAGLAGLVFGAPGVITLAALGLAVLVMQRRVPVRTVLAFTRARQLPYQLAPGLHDAVNELSRRAGLAEPPALYYVDSRMPNAFSLGEQPESALVVTDGLLQRLDDREVLAVLAHEISHLRSGDTRVMNLSAALARFTTTLAWVGLFLLLIGIPRTAPGWHVLLLGAVLVIFPLLIAALQLAFARAREFDADLGAAKLTGDPEALADALERLEWSTGRLWERVLLPKRHGRGVLVESHPATGERVRRLRQLAGSDRRGSASNRPVGASLGDE